MAKVEILLNVENGKSFYRIENSAPIGDRHVLARIEPHSRQKIGDEIVIMLEAASGVPTSSRGELCVVPMSSVSWGSGTSTSPDSDATYEPNIRIGNDLVGSVSIAHGLDGEATNRYVYMLNVGQQVMAGYSTEVTAKLVEIAAHAKLFKLMWTGDYWVMTSPVQVLDMFS